MTCAQMVRYLNEYVEGALDPSLCRRFEGHMEGCRPCRAFLASLKKTLKALRALKRPKAPAAAKSRLRRRLKTGPGPFRG